MPLKLYLCSSFQNSTVFMDQNMTRLIKFLAIVLLSLTPTISPAFSAETSDVKITDIKVGEGFEALDGMRVSVHYTGWTLDGKQFDSSRESNKPFGFFLGNGEVIQGWEIGIKGMKEGGKRELIIPSELAYGKDGFPDLIGPNETLKFEIKLLEVSIGKYTNVNMEYLNVLLARGVPIFDVRRPAEAEATGVIEGTKLVTGFLDNKSFSKDFFRTLLANVKKSDEFIMVDSNGKRSGYLAKIMSQRKGYNKLFVLRDGIDGWIKDGGAVVPFAKEASK